ncbi:MAG: Na/Pi cotransporter family protein, partial [Alphaproteobacteria bacterium]|nr:Na/Pi cotransporter family protein [Alphaproteobacteria bacterium]
MSATEVLIQLLGGAALLIWGLRMVRTGVMRAYGSSLRRSVGMAMTNRVSAAAAGFGATLFLQSSTATGLLAGSFASRGLIATAPALAVMLGADIGSAVVAQVLSLGVQGLAPIFVFLGVVLFTTGRGSRRRDIGRALIGLGLMLLALRLLVGASEVLRTSAPLKSVFGALGGELFFAALVAAIVAWIAHSSLAAVMLVVSLADQGIAPGALGLALVLGANIGGALAPYVATLDQPAPGRRVPLGNLLFKVAGFVVVLPFLGLIAPELAAIDPAPGRAVAHFHVAFNIALALVFIGLTGPAARLVERFLPEPPAEADQGKARYLDLSALDVPTVAISCAARETMRMADTVEAMLAKTLEVLRVDDRKLVGEIEKMDDTVDKLHEAIKLYLTEITRREEGLGDVDSRRWSEIMAFTTNLEHIGDIVDKNLMELASKRIKNGYRFSEEGFAEI